jgi:hypothetical protein
VAVRRLLLFLIALGLLIAVASLPLEGWRMAAERRVEFAINLSDARNFSATHLYPLERVLDEFRQAGVTTAVVSEKTLHELVTQGQLGFPGSYPIDLAVLSGLEVAVTARLSETGTSRAPDMDSVYIFVRSNPALTDLLARQIAMRLGADRVNRHSGREMGAGAEAAVLAVRAEKDWLLATPLGIFPADVATAEAAGLLVVYSFRQSRGQSTHAPDLLMQDLPPGPQRILFTGDSVPGWPGQVGLLADLLRQRGDTLLIDYRRRAQTNELIRVAGVPQLLEAAGNQANKVYRPWIGERLEDWVTASKDRNMRFLLFPMLVLSENASEDVAKQIGSIRRLRQALEPLGFAVGPVEPRQPFGPPPWAIAGAAVAVVAGAAWLASFAMGAPWVTGLLLVGMTGAAALLFAAPLLARQALAFLAAFLFPAIGGFWALDRLGGAGWRAFAAAAVRAFLPSLAAGLLIHALLGETLFLLEIQLFRGVKIALIAPLLLLAGLLAVRTRREALGAAAAAFQTPVRAGHILVMGALAVAGAVLLIRSTNQIDGALVLTEPTQLELRLRAFLESALLARPRFKEFAFGYPLLALGVFLIHVGQTRWGQVAAVLGMVAATSVVNSFVHLHTPLHLSILRGLHGLWLGLLAGSALYLLARRLTAPEAGRDRHV